MGATEREHLFRESLQAYDRGDLDEAAEGFQQLVRDGSHDPRHISYCGLLVATVEGRIHDGRVLCELALREAPENSEMLVNLARFYACIGNPAKSFQMLDEAIRLDPKDMLPRRELSRLDRRAAPAIPFLKREHPVNRTLGWTRVALTRWLRRDSQALI